MESIEARVAAGAAWLDENRPGWEGKIDLGQFDIKSTCLCILGQLMGHYHQAVHQNEDFRYGQAFQFGFNLPDEDMVNQRMWEELQDAWVSLIKERFDTGNLSG